MKMLDKDFDQLFNSKLGDMEIEPSASVWNNITDELDGKQKKEKGGLPFMQIAASIIVLMAVGLYFLRPTTEKIALHGTALNQQVANQYPLASAKNLKVNNIDTSTVKITQTTARVAYKRYKPVPMVLKESVSRKPEQVPVLARVNDYQPYTETDVHSTAIAAQTQTMASVTKPAVTPEAIIPVKANVLAQVTTAVKERTKRKGIHSLGDLLNVVIAKVDKREDKLIKFTNDDDNDSFNITGINLGIINAKKDK